MAELDSRRDRDHDHLQEDDTETNSLLVSSSSLTGGSGEMRMQVAGSPKSGSINAGDMPRDSNDKQAKRMLSNVEMFGLSCYWFGWSALMSPLFIAVIPQQIEILSEDKSKGSALGDTLIWGSVVAILVAPLAGSISDTSTHPWGRRKPFIATGLVIASFALLLMAIAPNLKMYACAFLLLSAANNVTMSPYTALVPDLVPQSQRGTVSSWLGVMSFLGTFTGGLVTFFFPSPVSDLIILGLIHAGSGLITMHFSRERPLVHRRADFSICQRLWSLFRPMFNHDFRVMFSTRFLMQMGILTVQEYMRFFLKDAIQDFTLFGYVVASSAQQAVCVMFVPMLIGGLGSACISGVYSDRTGKRKMVVYVSGGVMMVACVLFSLIRSYTLVMIAAFIFGCGFGAFSVIEWAMATDLLPNPEEYAKDMGIWSLALIMPQVIRLSTQS